MNEQMNKRIHQFKLSKWMNEWANKRINKWINESINKWMSKRMKQHMSSPLCRVFNKDRHRADLNGVCVVRRVLKQTVVRVEQFSGQQEEKLTRRSSIIQTVQHNVDSNQWMNQVVRQSHLQLFRQSTSIFTALHALRSSHDKDVCPSVKRVICDKTKESCAHNPHSYTTWMIIHPSFVTRRMVGGGDPLYLKFWVVQFVCNSWPTCSDLFVGITVLCRKILWIPHDISLNSTAYLGNSMLILR